MKVSCVIVDDEKLAREGLQAYVEQIPFLELVGQFKGVLELNEVLDSLKPELAFLDIEMPQLSGVDWLRNCTDPPKVIFTTAYREFALDGYDLDVVDFLVKPISFPRFLKASNKARTLIQAGQGGTSKSTSEHIFIKAEDKIIKLVLDEILFFEANSDYVFVHTLQQRFLTLNSLKSIATEVADAGFIRTHRSYIVNKKHVEAIEGKQVLIQGHKLPISRQYYQPVYNEIVGDRLW